MKIDVTEQQEALGLFDRWREHDAHGRRWDALLELLELRELLLRMPAADVALPADFSVEQQLRLGAT